MTRRGIDDATEDERGLAADPALRRLAVLEDLLWRLRQEVLPARMIAAALGVLAAALGAEGGAIVAAADAAAEPVGYCFGAAPELLAPIILDIAGRADAAPTVLPAAGGPEYLACPCRARFRRPEFLLFWRAAGEVPWSAEDCRLLDAAAGLLRLLLEHEAIQQETVLQARTDPLTGLADRRGFTDELARRIDRLERDGLPGTLLLMDADGLGRVNERAGLETGDAVLRVLAVLLRGTFRPTDLLGRVGGDEFAVWLDGADALAAAERADALNVAAAVRLAALAAGPMPSLSIGIATRWPGDGEELDALMARVDAVLREVKQTARGTWRVANG